jgi:hypothetical protein
MNSYKRFTSYNIIVSKLNQPRNCLNSSSLSLRNSRNFFSHAIEDITIKCHELEYL